MTRADALTVLHRLSGALAPNAEGCARLLERIASHDESELLRDTLVEIGAQALLGDALGERVTL